jgi:hypothetical protein
MPFWVLAYIGLAVSTWWAVMAESLWIAKYAVINKVLFVHPQVELEPAFDAASGA